MSGKRFQEKLNIINESISFWDRQSEKVYEKILRAESLGIDAFELRSQFKFCYKKIEFEKEQLAKIENEFILYKEKFKKIRRGHYHKSFLS